MTATSDPLVEKLSNLKEAFAQLMVEADSHQVNPRKAQNLAQVMAEVEAEVEAVAEVEAEAEVEVEVEAEAEGYHHSSSSGDEYGYRHSSSHSSSSSDELVKINIFNGEAENRRRPWDVKKDVCVPERG